MTWSLRSSMTVSASIRVVLVYLRHEARRELCLRSISASLSMRARSSVSGQDSPTTFA